jgi:hypothetical protein
MKKIMNNIKKAQTNFPRGVLKIKKGYNPNSSSIGTVVYSFPVAFMVMSGILAVLAGVIRKKPSKETK